ncbi:MAG: hypothetical protein DMF89_13860 [Acidobacteria bacterium]|nr:MAG: hypothetical protein DMF89_13860 [Acidobacteriota bacterium]
MRQVETAGSGSPVKRGTLSWHTLPYGSPRVLDGACGCAIAPIATAADTDKRLIDAVRAQDRDLIRALVAAHVDVNASQADGATALHWAIHWADVEAANLLIRAGARVDATNDYGVHHSSSRAATVRPPPPGCCSRLARIPTRPCRPVKRRS